MEDRPPSRKRRDEGAQHGRPPVRLSNQTKARESLTMQSPSRTRQTKNSTEIIKTSSQPGAQNPRSAHSSLEAEPPARHFTVANVGRGGALYLQPSRSVPQSPNSPKKLSYGHEGAQMDWRRVMEISAATSRTSRLPSQTQRVREMQKSGPPVSMDNAHPRSRPRSHSFSSFRDASRITTHDATEFQLLLGGQNASKRPKSSVEIARGLLDLQIPHYRLGTPRFTDRGTAYLHNSVYNSTAASIDLRSSVLSRADFDKLLTIPAGRRSQRPEMHSRTSSTTPFPQPPGSIPWTPSPAPPIEDTLKNISPEIFDLIETCPDDPSIVRYSSITGHILAATPARLIAQITSPLFLDYELLADFFLAFRSFMSRGDLLEYLVCRMKWALSRDQDAGRIVGVRTFVALRHWILNYFADDFAPDYGLRQTLCKRVNGLVSELRQRPAQSLTNINLLGELKKCWSRTASNFWPSDDLLENDSSAEVVPGGPPPLTSSTAMHTQRSAVPSTPRMDFRRTSIIKLPAQHDKTPINATPAMKRLRAISIPASPMSEQSIEVLCCSVPFLGNFRSIVAQNKKTRVADPSNPISTTSEKAALPSSGNGSGASRTVSPPIRAVQAYGAATALETPSDLTGGLVRGLLLQPSPAIIEKPSPPTPPEVKNQRPLASGKPPIPDGQPIKKRAVGDVYRVLAGRKGAAEQQTSTAFGVSHLSESRSTDETIGQPRKNLNSMEIATGMLLRTDMLGEMIQGSYVQAFDAVAQQDDSLSESQELNIHGNERNTTMEQTANTLIPESRRLQSHITTSSRSIVIMDDTKPFFGIDLNSLMPPPHPSYRQSAPGPSSGIFNTASGIIDLAHSPMPTMTEDPHHDASWIVANPPLNELLAAPIFLEEDNSNANLSLQEERMNARKSSNVYPAGVEMPPIRHQLRRVPGGDLKAAEHAHEFEVDPRPSDDSFSTFTRSHHIASRDNATSRGASPLSPGFVHDSRLQVRGPSDTRRGSWSLLQTHSSQPHMSPSFQAQISHLASLPDRNADGGVEDALAKLEGKPVHDQIKENALRLDSALSTNSSVENRPRELRIINGGTSIDASTPTEGTVRSPKTETYAASTNRTSVADTQSSKRRVTGQSMGSPFRSHPASPSFSSPVHARKSSVTTKSPDFSKGSTLLAELRDLNDEKVDEYVNLGHVTSQESFLLDDTQSLSDISTDLGADQSEDEGIAVRSFFFDDTINQQYRALPPPRPDSILPPPDTERNDSNSNEGMKSLSARIEDDRHLLRATNSAPRLESQTLPSDSHMSPDLLRRAKTISGARTATHLPFVLAFDSATIAEQMTIIEKDALDEITWNDLMSLNWQHTPPIVTDWVSFLQDDDANGIDLVIARFNVVVKWIVSECVLTISPTERARALSKYIHIAAHAQRLRNYATTYQITLALLSADLARLRHTWNLVSEADKEILKELEELCQPQRNFHRLRADMDALSEVASDAPCIPFIGLFTHDLVFNAQKPARLAPAMAPRLSVATPRIAGRGEMLVNFERYQTAAAVVKDLRRLVDASSRYVLRPHPEVLSRCLWLAALEDGEIAARSRALEP